VTGEGAWLPVRQWKDGAIDFDVIKPGRYELELTSGTDHLQLRIELL